MIPDFRFEIPKPGRLPVATVQRLERVLGGDSVVEDQVLRFARERYGAGSLFTIPEHVAVQILRRPADFLSAVRRRFQPELGF